MTTQGRLPGETTKAYKAYCIYRDMGDPRSLKQVATEMGHASRAVVSRWSGAFNWTERVREVDAKREEEIAAINFGIKQAAAIRHMERSQRLQDMGMSELERALAFSQQSEIPLIRPQDALKMVETGFKMERLVMGESTEKSDQVVARRELSDRELENYDRMITSRMFEDQEEMDTDVE